MIRRMLDRRLRQTLHHAILALLVMVPLTLGGQSAPGAQIPPPYWGRWGLGVLCASTLDNPLETMTIAARSIITSHGPMPVNFGDVKRVTTTGGRLIVDGTLGVDGDSEEYRFRRIFVLRDGGSRLDEILEPGRPARAYRRCQDRDPNDATPVDDWPGGAAHTVVISSETSLAAARATLQRAQNANIEAGLLLSSNYSSLRPGYWVVFSGYFSTSGEAARWQSRVRAAGFKAAYARQVSP